MLGVLTAAVLVGLLTVRMYSVVAMLITTALGAMALVFLVRSMGSDKQVAFGGHTVLWWTVAAFAAHLVVGLMITNSSTLSSYLGGDAFTYHFRAIAVLDSWKTGLRGPSLPNGRSGFYYLLAGLYWLVGPQIGAGLALNATLGAAIVPLTTDVTRRLFGEKAALYTPALVVLLPSFFVWTSQLLKEATILFLVALALNCAVRIVERVSPGAVLGLMFSLAVLFNFRHIVALTVAAGLLVGLAVGRQAVLSGIGVALSVLALTAVLILTAGVGGAGYQAALDLDLRQASATRKGLAVGANSGFNAAVDVSTTGNALSYLPKGLIVFSVGPFPWQLGGARQLPALFDVVALWAMLPSLRRGFRLGRDLAGRRIYLLVIPAAVTSIPLALAVGNFGFLARERMQVLLMLVPLISLGLATRKQDADPTEDGERALASTAMSVPDGAHTAPIP